MNAFSKALSDCMKILLGYMAPSPDRWSCNKTKNKMHYNPSLSRPLASSPKKIWLMDLQLVEHTPGKFDGNMRGPWRKIASQKNGHAEIRKLRYFQRPLVLYLNFLICGCGRKIRCLNSITSSEVGFLCVEH